MSSSFVPPAAVLAGAKSKAREVAVESARSRGRRAVLSRNRPSFMPSGRVCGRQFTVERPRIVAAAPSGVASRAEAAAAILPVLDKDSQAFVSQHVGVLRAFADAACLALLLEVGSRLLMNLGLQLHQQGAPPLIANAILHMPASPAALTAPGELLLWLSLVAGGELGVQFVLNFRKRLNLPAFGRGAPLDSGLAGLAAATRAEAEAFLAALVLDAEDPEQALRESDFEEEPTSEEVLAMLQWICQMDSAESCGAVELVWQLARSEDRAIREAVADSLGDVLCESGRAYVSNGWIAALEHLAGDEDAEVKLAAVISLARVREAGLLQPAEGMAFLKAYRRSGPREAPEPGPAGTEKAARKALLRVRSLGSTVELEVPTLTPLHSFMALLLGGAAALGVELACVYNNLDSPLRFAALGFILAAATLVVYPDDGHLWSWLRRWRRKSPAPAVAAA